MKCVNARMCLSPNLHFCIPFSAGLLLRCIIVLDLGRNGISCIFDILFVRNLYFIFFFTKETKSKKMPKCTHYTLFIASTYLSPKNMLLSAVVKLFVLIWF